MHAPSAFFRFFVFQVKKSKFREPGGSKKKKNDAVAAGTGEVVKAELVERPREYVVTLHFPEVGTCVRVGRLSLAFVGGVDVDDREECWRCSNVGPGP